MSSLRTARFTRIDIALVFNVHAHFFLSSIASRCNAHAINNSRRVKSYLMIAHMCSQLQACGMFSIKSKESLEYIPCGMSCAGNVDFNEKFFFD